MHPSCAIVTGAAGRLGRALALRLAERGFEVALADVDEAGCRETLRLVEERGGRGRVEPLDVTSAEAWSGLRARLEREWDHLDVLVNNAGVCGAGEVGRFPLDDWQWLLDVNLRGVLHGCHTLVDWLRANPRGAHVINIASVAAMATAPTMPAYSVAKAGVVALSETLHGELAPHGVGVTVVCPGFFPSELLARGRFADPHQRALGERYMQRAIIDADDVARAALRAMDRRRLYVVLPWRARLLWRLKRWFPQTFARASATLYRRQLARLAKETTNEENRPSPAAEPTKM